MGKSLVQFGQRHLSLGSEAATFGLSEQGDDDAIKPFVFRKPCSRNTIRVGQLSDDIKVSSPKKDFIAEHISSTSTEDVVAAQDNEPARPPSSCSITSSLGSHCHNNLYASLGECHCHNITSFSAAFACNKPIRSASRGFT
jgi:hypothetical protein